MIIAIIITYTGYTALIEAIKKIINPEVPNYSNVSLIIVSVAILVKIVLGFYVKKMGKKVNSHSLINSGTDALNDSIISGATLLAAIIFIIFGISLEAWLGVIISILIIKAGFDMLKVTISQILGERVQSELSNAIKETVSSFEGVHGAYDLILNDYGPDTYMGSIHIEVEDTVTASEIDELTRKITKEVYDKHSVILTAIGIYSINTKDEELIKMRKNVSNIVHTFKSVLQMHGFYVNTDEKYISFDIIIDFEDKERENTYKEIHDKIKAEYPEYKVIITLDMDMSD
jgi:cation diffusion facilitator family transporter